MRAYAHMAFQYGMLMRLSIMLLAVLVPAATSVVATTRTSAREVGADDGKAAMAKPDCTAKCGNVTIPYPFGIGNPRCYFRPRFEITCNGSNPRLMKTRMIVTNISLEEGELQTEQLVNRVCFDSQGKPNDTEDQSKGGLSVIPPYTISGDKNMLVAVGCDTFVNLVGRRDDQNYTTGCLSRCQNDISSNAIDKNDSCSGMGCCETKIPPLLRNLNLTVASFIRHTRVWKFNPCGYAFVVRRGSFTFSNTSFQQLRKTTRLPLVLDWQIMDESCEIAMQNNKTYACKGNSTCHNTSSGYICQCSPGFRGNPYLEGRGSCQDINECDSNPCTNGQCKNIPGNYTCECNSGYQIVDNIKCIKVSNAKRLKIALGVSLSFSVLVVAILWIYRKNQVENLRRKYFDANGGVLLEKKLGGKARIYTERQVMEATNNYAVKNKLGEGRYGIVYKGVLDKQEVAIKKPQITDTAPPAPKQSTAPQTDQNQNTAAPTDQKQINPQEQFVNEMTVLYQINHNNVVRLVGCCLDSKTPILVYEYISNGSLHTRIHGKEGEKPSAPLPLAMATRLKIAAETAGALAYLHHDSVIKIIHRDVKTANVLLDENLTPKLSDFGASSLLVPEDENKKSILVRGSVGYVDPEYLDSKKPLTEKSDVYSFGVVLAELLTGRKAGEEAGEEGTWPQILDKKIGEGHLDEVRKAADLAKKCLKPGGEERPSMREVAAELQLLVLTMPQHPSGGGEAKDTSAECL